jgi:hypothetical protein
MRTTKGFANLAFGAVAAVLALITAYLMFVVTPYAIYAESKCLAAGYPDSRVTIGLDIYCVGIDGAVTNRVDKK